MSCWLIDKSAIGRLHVAVQPDEWPSRIDRGLVHIWAVNVLEVGSSARSADDHRTLLNEPPIASMPIEYLAPRIEDRAIALQSLLADQGQHRAP